MKEERVMILFLMCLVSILLSGYTLHLPNRTVDDCPCPERDDDPTGGILSPIEPLQYLEINFSDEFIDFRDIILENGQVEGWDLNRTARINITFFNKNDSNITAWILLRNGSISHQWDDLFIQSKIWIQDGGVTTYLYDWTGWANGDWWCETYAFNDWHFNILPNQNKTIKLFYTLEEQPPGAFIDGMIYNTPYEVFGVHIGENQERWEYFPLQVRT